MEGINFKTFEKEEYTVVHFDLDTPLVPEILQKIIPPKVNGAKGVILSGRGPIWLYCYLTHHYHPTKFVATYDPRVNGAVVIESHTPEHKPGEIIKMEIYEQ